jgi:hypothetical protein
MTYDRACELTGFTTPKSLAANAVLAEGRMERMEPGQPLRYQVALITLINAAK